MQKTIAQASALFFILSLVIGFASCADTVNNDFGPKEDRIREINKSVQAQKYICDDIPEPVYYRGRKIYNGCHTRYYKYQSTTSGKMYKPKRKPVCQELGERPFTSENLAEIKRIEGELVVGYRQLRNRNFMWVGLMFLFMMIGSNADRIDEMLSE